MDKHNKLREILIKYECAEFGDCIVDEISKLFNYPTTNDAICETGEGDQHGLECSENKYKTFQYAEKNGDATLTFSEQTEEDADKRLKEIVIIVSGWRLSNILEED